MLLNPLMGQAATYPAAQGQYPPNVDYPAGVQLVVTPATYPHLFATDGPCVGLTSCTVYVGSVPLGGLLVQTVFRNMRFWNYDARYSPPRLVPNWSGAIRDVPRWSTYICNGAPDAVCLERVGTRSFYTNSNGYLREVVKDAKGCALVFDAYTSAYLGPLYIDNSGTKSRARP